MSNVFVCITDSDIDAAKDVARTAATKVWLAKGKDQEINDAADPYPEYLTQGNLASKRSKEEDLAYVATKSLEVTVLHGHSVLTGDMVANMPPSTVVDQNGNPGDYDMCGVMAFSMIFA